VAADTGLANTGLQGKEEKQSRTALAIEEAAPAPASAVYVAGDTAVRDTSRHPRARHTSAAASAFAVAARDNAYRCRSTAAFAPAPGRIQEILHIALRMADGKT